MYAPTLLETRRPLASGGALGTGAVSFALHAALIAGVVCASLHTGALEVVGRLIVDVPRYQASAPRPPDLPVVVPSSPIALGTLPIPTSIPTTIPAEQVRVDGRRSAEPLRALFQHLRRSRVRLEFVLDTAGRVVAGSARVLASTHRLFSEAALAAVGTWFFRPGRIGGHAVQVRVRMPVDFVKERG